MYPNPIFRSATTAQNIEFARGTGFGMLCVNGPDGAPPVLSHIPFVLDEDGASAEMHLIRSNAIARALKSGPLPASIAVQGPHSYVSPDWYEIDDQVPTWNYIAVHVTGTLELVEQNEISGILDRISAKNEALLLPKTPWTMDKMPEEITDKMLRQIVPVRMTVTAIEGTWKLGQNKPDAVRLAAADQMDAYGFGSEPRLVSAMMRCPPVADA